MGGTVASSRPSSRLKRSVWSKRRGGNIAKVAKELGVYDSTLGNWVRQARGDAVGAPSVEERAEIRDLKRELDRVSRERDILAKAVAFFSASTRENG